VSIIRALKRDDYEAWLPLWQENCLDQISDDVTAETWRRLCHPKEKVFGLGAFAEAGELCGFVHYVLHDTTGYIEPACYMQDLFIAPDYRRQGIAKRLVWELHDIGKVQKWARIYWFAAHHDEAVQNLYKTLGIKANFSLHMLATQE